MVWGLPLDLVGVFGVVGVERTRGVDAAVLDLGVVLDEDGVSGVVRALEVDEALVVVEVLGAGAFS